MRLEIIKCHGSGNDFPLIDAREIVLSDGEWAVVARTLADRSGCVGGDGLLALTADLGFRMWNSDGSEAETCLNGVRCVARLAFERLQIATATLRLRTSEVTVTRSPDISPGVYTVSETAGPATRDVASWPLTGEGLEIVEQPIARVFSERAFTAVAMPNPHLIAFVDSIDEEELVEIGLVCEAAPKWLPNRANVSFVQVLDASTLFVLTHERGVGLTNSCGSAMAASTHAAALTGRIEWGQEITVRNNGGMIRASAERDGMVTLLGNATFEWDGEVSVDPATGTARDLLITRHLDEEVAAWNVVLTA